MGMQKQKSIQLQGALPPDLHRGLCPLDSRWGQCPQALVIGSRCMLAMEVMGHARMLSPGSAVALDGPARGHRDPLPNSQLSSPDPACKH